MVLASMGESDMPAGQQLAVARQVAQQCTCPLPCQHSSTEYNSSCECRASCPYRSQEKVSMQCCGEKLILSLPKLPLAAQTKVDPCTYLLGSPTWKRGGGGGGGGAKHLVP